MTIFDKARDIKAVQMAMMGKSIKPSNKSSFVPGGKWEVVQQFNGKSHAEGGIDLEVGDGYVRRVHGSDDADDIAKNGRFWKNLGAGAYGLGEGVLDTVTMGATDSLTDLGYNALQKAGGGTEDEMREQNSIRGYGTAAGAIGTAAFTGGATTGTAIQQTAKGVGAGIGEGSRGNKTADAIGTYLPLAGSIAGMAVGNAGFKGGVEKAQEVAGNAKKAADLATQSGDTVGAAAKTAEAAKYAAKADRLSAFGKVADKASSLGKFNPYIQAGNSILQAQQPQSQLGGFQQGVRQVTPYATPSMISTFGQYRNALSQENNEQKGVVDGYTKGSDDTSIFWNQPTLQQNAMDYLGKYGING